MVIESDTTLTDSSILIVDDDPKSLVVLEGMLEQVGFKVHMETSGKSALQYVESSPPDLILLDIKMPDMDGFEVCRRLKSDPDSSDIPILFVSVIEDLRDRVAAFEAGGADYIAKPLQYEEVIARVKTHLQVRRYQQVLKSERDTLARDLEVVESYHQHLFENVPVGVAVTTPDGQMIEAQGGRIWLESEEGEGAKFNLELKAATAS